MDLEDIFNEKPALWQKESQPKTRNQSRSFNSPSPFLKPKTSIHALQTPTTSVNLASTCDQSPSQNESDEPPNMHHCMERLMQSFMQENSRMMKEHDKYVCAMDEIQQLQNQFASVKNENMEYGALFDRMSNNFSKCQQTAALLQGKYNELLGIRNQQEVFISDIKLAMKQYGEYKERILKKQQSLEQDNLVLNNENKKLINEIMKKSTERKLFFISS